MIGRCINITKSYLPVFKSETGKPTGPKGAGKLVEDPQESRAVLMDMIHGLIADDSWDDGEDDQTMMVANNVNSNYDSNNQHLIRSMRYIVGRDKQHQATQNWDNIDHGIWEKLMDASLVRTTPLATCGNYSCVDGIVVGGPVWEPPKNGESPNVRISSLLGWF